MLDPIAYETIRIERRDNGVAVAILNRPERLNAVNARMHRELSRIARDVEHDRTVKVLVLTGAGRAFSAGGDFSGSGIVSEGGTDLWQEARMIVDHLLECTKPLIAAVNGYAMGLGATVALLCDVVIAARSAVFADTHVRMGIGAGDGGQVIWPFLMGVNRAKYYLMSGDRVTAEEAERMGLVTFVVDDDQLMTKALEIADRFATGPSLAIAASKVPINQWLRGVSAQVLPLSLEMERHTFASDDAKEAALAFNEKRAPQFKGK